MFSGVVASISKLGKEDALAIWAMITFSGGQLKLHLDNSCTHLIIGKPEGVSSCTLNFTFFYVYMWNMKYEIVVVIIIVIIIIVVLCLGKVYNST